MGAETDRIGRVVGGRYELAGVLGRGGMGVVWLADDQLLDRQVALKEVTFSLGLTEEERGILRERTMREARTAARLDHPCVTKVYDVVEEEGKPWLVMEHVPSRSLQDIVSSDGPLPPDAVARIGLDVLAALDAAHRAGIVHRDVKPANVLVGPDGHACLTDFGIATSTGDSSLTTQGAIIGSPSYMAPERANGEEPQPPVDLWSLGATLYTAAEGRLAFDRGEPMATLLAVVSEEPAPMTGAGPLEPVLLRLLAKDPAQRADVAEARRGLEAVLTGQPPAPPRAAAPTPTPPPPSTPRAPVGGGELQRLDSDDLRALASASKALLGDVARGAARGAREMAGRELARRRERTTGRNAAPAPPRRRWRFKRRWVLVPLLSTLAVIALALVGLGLWLAHVFGQF
jgi:serine/threonine protein kinase